MTRHKEGTDHHEEVHTHVMWKYQSAILDHQWGGSKTNILDAGKAPGERTLPRAKIAGKFYQVPHSTRLYMEGKACFRHKQSLWVQEIGKIF